MELLRVIGGIAEIYTAFFQLKGQEFKTLSRTYGTRVALFIIFAYPNTASEYDRLERVVLRGREEEALLFRDAVANECNMTAIAVSSPCAGERLSRRAGVHTEINAGCHYCPSRADSALAAKSKSSPLDSSCVPSLCHSSRLPIRLLRLQAAESGRQTVST